MRFSAAKSSEEEKETLKKSQREEQTAIRQSEEKHTAKGPGNQHQKYCKTVD